MALPTRLPGAFAVLLYLQCFCNIVHGQNASLPGFGDTVRVLGGMERTDQQFQDGLNVGILSPKERILAITQNKTPLATTTLARNSGGPFVALSNYSYVVKMNESANDLIAKIEIPSDPNLLRQQGIQESNTFVATLASDGMSWTINDPTRRTEKSTCIDKLMSIDGEYMLVGRQTGNSSTEFVEYGQGAARTVDIPGGTGVQQVEFMDGMTFMVQTNKDLKVNVELKEGVNPGTLPANTMSLNSYMWIVNTSAPFERVNAEMRVPFNRNMLVAMRPDGSSPSTMLQIGRRALNASTGTFLPFNRNVQFVKELPDDKLVVPQVNQLDGQFIILVTDPKDVGETTPHAGIIKAGKRELMGTLRS